jgi:non-homologous end joining protein Ku
VRAVDEFRTDTTRIREQELELATMLVRALAAPFEPSKCRDHYQENLRALLEAKIQGKETEDRVSKPALAPVMDILEALKPVWRASNSRRHRRMYRPAGAGEEECGLARNAIWLNRGYIDKIAVMEFP